MAYVGVTESFGVDECQIQAVLTDPTGGTATYGSMIAVPAIKTISVTGTIKEEDLRGDGQLIDSRAKLTHIAVAFNYGQLSFAALAAILGGAQATSGTTPNQVTTYSLLGTDSTLLTFALQARSKVGADEPGDQTYIFYKLRSNAFPGMGFADEAFHIFSGGAKSLPQRATGKKWFDIKLKETAAPIVALS